MSGLEDFTKKVIKEGLAKALRDDTQTPIPPLNPEQIEAIKSKSIFISPTETGFLALRRLQKDNPAYLSLAAKVHMGIDVDPSRFKVPQEDMGREVEMVGLGITVGNSPKVHYFTGDSRDYDSLIMVDPDRVEFYRKND